MKFWFANPISVGIASVLLLSGCNSTPNVNPRVARFDSSEVYAEPFNVKLSVGTNTSNQISIDALESPESNSAARLSAAVSLGNGFEAKYEANVDGEADDQKFSVKYQFYGAPSEASEEGNVSLAASLGYVDASQRGASGGYFSQSGYSWDADNRSVDLAIIGGYRWTPQLLIYGSLYYQSGELSGSNYLREYTSSTGEVINPGCTGRVANCIVSTFEEDGDNIGANVALEYSWTNWLAITGEVAVNKAEWFDRDNTQTAANVNIEFRF